MNSNYDDFIKYMYEIKQDKNILKEYISLNELANFLNANKNTLYSLIKRNLIINEDFYSLNYSQIQEFSKLYDFKIGKKVRLAIAINKKGIKKIILTIRNNILAENIKQHFKISEYKNTRKESFFLKDLEDFLNYFQIEHIKQFNISNYYIDCYIPCFNIAIEYDENEHKDYSHERHLGRQQKIEEILHCKFIRLSDKKSNSFNIAIISKAILETKNIYKQAI